MQTHEEARIAPGTEEGVMNKEIYNELEVERLTKESKALRDDLILCERKRETTIQERDRLQGKLDEIVNLTLAQTLVVGCPEQIHIENQPLLHIDPTAVVCSVPEGFVVLHEVSVEGIQTLYEPKTTHLIFLDASVYAKEGILTKGRIIQPIAPYNRMKVKGYYDGSILPGMKPGDEFTFSLTYKP
jgi:hypothetical protein